MHPMFNPRVRMIAKIWEQSKYPLIEHWIKKIQFTYTEETTQPYKRMKSNCMMMHDNQTFGDDHLVVSTDIKL